MRQELTELVRTHQASVWRYLRYLGCPAAQAEDLAQETFLAVWRQPFDDRGPESTAAYLRTVARNLFLMARRREGRVANVEQAALLAADEDAVWERYVHDSRPDAWVEALQDCLEGLFGATVASPTGAQVGPTDGPLEPTRVRRALEMFYRHDRSRAEIAAALAMSEEGVKTLLRRAREALRGCVERKTQVPLGKTQATLDTRTPT